MIIPILAKNMGKIYELVQFLCKNTRKMYENVLPISKILFYPSNGLELNRKLRVATKIGSTFFGF
jgi:hypothetical protein